MTGTTAAHRLTAPFDAPWRDGAPVFACCRKAVAIAVDAVDVGSVAALDVTARVQALRNAVDAELPGHVAAHRCCAGHLADLAFDMPQLLAPVDEE